MLTCFLGSQPVISLEYHLVQDYYLIWRRQVNNFLKQLSMVMGLYESPGSRFLLYIGRITPVNHESGITPDDRIKLKKK